MNLKNDSSIDQMALCTQNETHAQIRKLWSNLFCTVKEEISKSRLHLGY